MTEKERQRYRFTVLLMMVLIFASCGDEPNNIKYVPAICDTIKIDSMRFIVLDGGKYTKGIDISEDSVFFKTLFPIDTLK